METIEAERPDHEFVSTQCANCSRIDAQQMTLNVLQATQGGVDVIYAHNDEMILGAIAAVKEFGLEPGKDVRPAASIFPWKCVSLYWMVN